MNEHTDATLETAPETAPEAAEEHTAVPGFWRAVWMAIKGTNVDYTEAPMRHAIVLLAVPMVLEMVMESVFAVVDIFFVSRLGPEQVAVVGLTESLMTLVYTVAMGLSIGVTAMIARRAGEKDQDAAGHTAAQAVLLGAGIAIVLGVVGSLSAPWTPTWVNLLCFWLFQIPLAWVLAQTLGMGPWGVHIAVMLGFSSEAVVAGLLFRRGKWKDQKV